MAILSLLVVTFVAYPAACQAVLNFFSCYKLDNGKSGYLDNNYGSNQLVRAHASS